VFRTIIESSLYIVLFSITAKARHAPPTGGTARSFTTSVPTRSSAARRAFVLVPMQAFAANGLESFKEFPPRQKPTSFNLDEVMRKMEEMGKASGND